MRKRSLCLALLLLVSLLSEGCCWCHRPFLFRRWGCGGCCDSCCATPCCGTSYFGSSGCCDHGGGGGTIIDGGYGLPPIGPGVPGSAPTMPNATPLVRARLGMNK